LRGRGGGANLPALAGAKYLRGYMIARLLTAVSAAALSTATAAGAAPSAPEPATATAAAADPAVLFGAREGVENISLSPSGGKVAFIAPGKGQGTILYVADTVGGAAPVVTLTASGDPERITNCRWVSDARLVCYVYMLEKIAGELLPFTRTVAVDAGGGNLKMLSNRARYNDTAIVLSGDEIVDWLPGDEGAVLMARTYVPQEQLGTRMLDKREGYGVDRLDTRSLNAKSVEAARKGASEYISDGYGNVRIMGLRETAGATGQDTGVTTYFYRQKGSRDWKKLGEYDSVHGLGFNPYAVDSDKDLAYGLKPLDGRLAAYSVALDGSGRETLVFSHPQVDVDNFVRIGRSRRVVGVSYVTDRRHVAYFDPALQSLAKGLSKALPNLPLIDFVDSSSDEGKLLLFAGSDSDPGRYYLFDRGKQQLAELMLSRPDMEGMKLASVRHVTYKAADGTEVPAYLTLPLGGDGRKLPALVMPHGGPEARDEWGFDWLAQYFANRGYAVLQPEFRGSTGYGEAWFNGNGFRSWRTAIGDVNDAGRWLVAQGIADPAKLGIFGWSYGGYAALQSNVLDPKLFKAVVAVAPVTDLATLVRDWEGWSNHAIEAERVGSGPEVREGSPAQHADKFVAPVLLFHGDMDRNVNVHQSQLMADRLRDAGKSVQLVLYPKHDHQLDDNETRTDMLRKADAFLRSAMKLP
jgi:dipeptidyl aminopeptidase/acylaminoacyl peptidase